MTGMTETDDALAAVLKGQPLYLCHKQVRATKILQIWDGPQRGQRCCSIQNFTGVIVLDQNFLTRHQPRAGGYLVLYEDGYVSYSPATAFEKGYTAADAEMTWRDVTQPAPLTVGHAVQILGFSPVAYLIDIDGQYGVLVHWDRNDRLNTIRVPLRVLKPCASIPDLEGGAS